MLQDPDSQKIRIRDWRCADGRRRHRLSRRGRAQLVYADDYDRDNLDAAVPIGTTCRLCECLDCEQRASHPLRGPLFNGPTITPTLPIGKKKRR